jgi:hypothetical protein
MVFFRRQIYLIYIINYSVQYFQISLSRSLLQNPILAHGVKRFYIYYETQRHFI